MKALENLTNTEKARLLYNLFPAEIPLFLQDLTKFCADLKERKEICLKEWDCGLMTFDYWFSIAENRRHFKKTYFQHEKSVGFFLSNSFLCKAASL